MRKSNLSELDKEIFGLVDDIRRNLTAIELSDDISDLNKKVIIDWFSTARSAVENAAFCVKD